MRVRDYVLLVLVLLCVVAALVTLHKKKKAGRCIGCGGDCSACGYKR